MALRSRKTKSSNKKRNVKGKKSFHRRPPSKRRKSRGANANLNVFKGSSRRQDKTEYQPGAEKTKKEKTKKCINESEPAHFS